MSAAYLAEHAAAARLALDLAKREAEHLHYTCRTLYAQPIDLAWVESLGEREDLSEKIDAFVGRFGRLQDHIGEKLLPAFSALVGGQPKSLLDIMAFAERMGWVADAEEFIGARKLRNLLVHEYMTEPALFLEALVKGQIASEMLFGIIAAVEREAVVRGLVAT